MDPIDENDVDGKSSTAVSAEVLDDLIQRAHALIAELEELRKRLRELRQEGTVELAHFRGTVQSELSMLEKLSLRSGEAGSSHIARSSNVPFLETVWASAKRSKNVVALQKRIILDSGSKSLAQGMRHVRLGPDHKKQKGTKHDAVVVDTIADGGRTWLKVSLVTNTRLLFDLAKQGWDSDGSDNESDVSDVFDSVNDVEQHADVTSKDNGDDDGSYDVPLLKTAKSLARATRLFRVRTKHPSVQLILPRVREGQSADIDKILDNCRKAGVRLICGESSSSPGLLQSCLSSMAPDPFDDFTSTLNIDCTILLALVSDFSHAKVSKEPWFHRGLQRQVEIEGNENLLPSLLYPAMRDRTLVCTLEAAHRMREIVDTIGTPSEKARTAILLGDGTSDLSPIQMMQQWSAYDVPDDWQLPIQTVDADESDLAARLPQPAPAVSAGMTAINRSVFLYGWAHGLTTITSNRALVKAIEHGLEQFAGLPDDVWPRLWLCPTARSLVGKEKRSAAAAGKKDRAPGAWPLPDPLRREDQRLNGLDVLSMREGRRVVDLRPDGYQCDDVYAAKLAAREWS